MKTVVVTKKNEKNTSPKIVETKTVTTAPTRKRRNRRRRANGRRLAVHPYVSSLINPDGVRGASIPDAISSATGTYSYVADFSYTADGSGNGFILYNPKMMIGNAGQSTGTASACQVGLIGGNATAGFGSAANTLAPILANPDVSSNVERFRVVSAELQAWSSAAPVNIQGRVCSGLLPSDYDQGSSAFVTSFAVASQLPNSITTHMIEGGRSVYLPGGPDDLLYAPCANDVAQIRAYNLGAAGGQLHSTSYQSGGQQTNASGPTCFLAFSGLGAGAVLNCRIVCNIQYQAASNNAFVQLEPVPADPAAMQLANAIASYPRKLQGFLETHAERLAGVFDGFVAGMMKAAPSVASAVGQSVMSSVTNSLLGARLGRPPGGQLRGFQAPRLM